MYEFKKGDQVRIRDDIAILKSEPPGISFEMKQMGGMVCTIQDAGRDICALNEVPYIWLYKWLEPYEEEPDLDSGVQNIADIL